jgi:hypothetical protein
MYPSCSFREKYGEIIAKSVDELVNFLVPLLTSGEYSPVIVARFPAKLLRQLPRYLGVRYSSLKECFLGRPSLYLDDLLGTSAGAYLNLRYLP